MAVKKSTFLIYCIALAVIAGAAVYIHAESVSNPGVPVPSPAASAIPTPTSTPAPSPSASPIGATYADPISSLSFQYPDGYYVFQGPPNNTLHIQNLSYPLSGVPGPDFREIEIQYGPNAADEGAAKAQAGVSEKDVAANGSTVRLYTYPNPLNPAYTIGEAYWEGKVPFSLYILWDTTVNSPEQGKQQADELSVMMKILPTISIAR